MIQLFVMSLGLGGNRDIDAWYDGFPPKGISSYQQVIEAFCDQWDPNVKEEILNIMKDKQASEEHEALLDDKKKIKKA